MFTKMQVLGNGNQQVTNQTIEEPHKNQWQTHPEKNQGSIPSSSATKISTHMLRLTDQNLNLHEKIKVLNARLKQLRWVQRQLRFSSFRQVGEERTRVVNTGSFSETSHLHACGRSCRTRVCLASVEFCSVRLDHPFFTSVFFPRSPQGSAKCLRPPNLAFMNSL